MSTGHPKFSDVTNLAHRLDFVGFHPPIAEVEPVSQRRRRRPRSTLR